MKSRIGTEEELCCQVCGRNTWHNPFNSVYRNAVPFVETINDVKTDIHRNSEILVCSKCFSTKLRSEDNVITTEILEYEEDEEQENGQIISIFKSRHIQNESIDIYPIIPNHELWNIRTIISNLDNLIKADIFETYKEAVECFNSGLFMTSGAMVRLGIMAIYDYKKIKPIVFEDLLTKKYHLSKYKQFLFNLTELKNIKILRLSISNRKELEVSIGVFEKLLIQRFFPQEDDYQSIKGILDRFDDSVTKRGR